MDGVDLERIERLRNQYALPARRRTSSLQKAAARFKLRARGLTSSSKASARRKQIEEAADGAALRKIYTRSFPRKG